MTTEMNEFLCALREAGSPLWEGRHVDRALLVNTAAQLIEKLVLAQSLDEAVAWTARAEQIISESEIKWRPAGALTQ